MTTIHLGTLSPTEDDNKLIDLKRATFEVTPVDTVTPSLTPTSSPEEDTMAGKKLYSLEKPDDKAKGLVAKLSLEEQVSQVLNNLRLYFCRYRIFRVTGGIPRPWNRTCHIL